MIHYLFPSSPAPPQMLFLLLTMMHYLFSSSPTPPLLSFSLSHPSPLL